MTLNRVQKSAMIDCQLKLQYVTDATVLEAMQAIPREFFILPEVKKIAYCDAPMPVASDRMIMDPATFARLLSEAGIRRCETLMYVGATTGYGVAVCAQLARQVTALEADRELADEMRKTLMNLNLGNVEVVTGDHRSGWAVSAPYDVIIWEGAIDHISNSWSEQLAPKGRMAGFLNRGETISQAVIVRKQKDSPELSISSGHMDTRLFPLPGFEPKPSFVF